MHDNCPTTIVNGIQQKEFIMDMSTQDLTNLFAQLGLDNSPSAIKDFIASHKLPADISLAQATFWNEAQANFLKENLKQDADWCVVIDKLNLLLRYK
jgi:hypothetical protein